MQPYDRRLKQRSRDLRKEMTDAEEALWRRLRRKQIAGLQFYRQKPLESFIVDFYCPAAKLVIELDGSQHHDPDYRIRDGERDARLGALGLKVLRFDNRQVLREMHGVLETIWREAEKVEAAANRGASPGKSPAVPGKSPSTPGKSPPTPL